MLPEILKDKIFVLRSAKSDSVALKAPEAATARVFMVSLNFEEIIDAAQVLNDVSPSDETPIIEVWTPGRPQPDAIVGMSKNQEACKECERRSECESQSESTDSSLSINKCQNPDAARGNNPQKEKDDKPCGLSKDVSIADILLEAYDALNSDKK